MNPGGGLGFEGFIIANLGGLLALSFFLGKLSNRVDYLERGNSEKEAALAKVADAVAKAMAKISEDVQRLRSAYHEMAGYMQIHHREWQPYDLDKAP